MHFVNDDAENIILHHIITNVRNHFCLVKDHTISTDAMIFIVPSDLALQYKLKSDADVTNVLDQVSNLRMGDKTLQINRAKCKTCEVADGSIWFYPWTGEEEKVILERCARCKVVWYCGKKCQQQSWRYHKPIRKKLNLN